MDDIYSTLLEDYEYDTITMKNKYILLDLGVINNNSYHVHITKDTINFHDLNDRMVAEYKYESLKSIKEIIDTFRDDSYKKPVTDDETFDNITIEQIMIPLLPLLPVPSSDRLKIYTYGHRNYNPSHIRGVEYHFDVSKYNSYLPATFGSLRYLTGRDEIVQKFVAMGEMFEKTLLNMLLMVENKKLTTIAIYCAHGKHRSVSFAEILKDYFYKKSVLNHLCIK